MTPNWTSKDKMYLVGNLQDYGKPYASLFLDKEAGQLYIFVRILDNKNSNDEYLVASVSSNDITDYMQQKTGLRSFFQNKKYLGAQIHNQQVMIDNYPEVNATSVIELNDVFNPNFCYDKLKLKVFLKRFNTRTYLNREEPKQQLTSYRNES